jgi:hypothetical protein
LQIGGLDINQANIEVSLVEFYLASLSKVNVDKIRKERKPVDCDSACLNGCDLRTGYCKLCFNKLPGQTCSVALIGFAYSNIYEMDIKQIANIAGYENVLNSLNYVVGVNSVRYSIFSHYRLFDFKALKNEKKFVLISVGNSKYTDPKVGTKKLSLDLKLINNRARFVWNINAEGIIIEEIVRDLEIVPD